ncbi:MAG TPA: hypothetical protein VGI92_06795 [Gemmatimonadales bacterium]
MGRLFAVVVTLFTVVSTALFVMHVWWLPPGISVVGSGVDRQINETMIMAGALFVISQLALACFAWRYADLGDARPVKTFPGGATPMVVASILLVGAEIVALTLVGSKVWAQNFMVDADPHALHIDVQAEQFAYYFRYAGADSAFGSMHPALINDANSNFFGLDPANDTTARDDIVAASLVVPVNRPIQLTLHSKDMGHSFYVPQLRLQQDFVPGMVIPLHFTANRTGKYEIVCTQLCGLGHYSMRAYLEVVTDERYGQWLKEQAP